jgi:glycyl-tRNA synthetase
MKKQEDFHQELLSFMQSKGFVWGPEPEIYNGMSGFYTYGPLGKLLKNKVEERIRKTFQREEFFEVECPIVMPKEVWQASGHLGGFTDPVIKDKNGASFRADNLIEEHFRKNNLNLKEINLEGASDEELLKIIKKYEIKSPNGTELVLEIKKHNLMMKTTIGLDSEAYNRPETATTTYLPFPRYNEFFRGKTPFGVFQIGKAFRNEISPRQHIVRMREFTQAEAQVFIKAEEKNNFEKYEQVKEETLPLWSSKNQEEKKDFENIKIDEALKKGFFKSKAYAWTIQLAYKLFLNLGIPTQKIRLRQHQDDEKAFYADDAWDVEIETKSFGWIEVCGVHDRTDYDLKTHAKHSGKNLESFDETTKEKFTPHVLEIAFGSDRPTFALMDLFYEKREKNEGKTTFEIPYHMSPVDVAVFPLMKKEPLKEKAKEVFDELKEDFITVYDEAGAIGKRYLRNAETGTPYCVTIDFDTLENKPQTVTIRDRDSEEQKRVEANKVKEVIKKLLRKEMEFSEI